MEFRLPPDAFFAGVVREAGCLRFDSGGTFVKYWPVRRNRLRQYLVAETFGNDGSLTTALSVTGLLIQTDGNIVAVGDSCNHLVLARYFTN